MEAHAPDDDRQDSSAVRALCGQGAPLNKVDARRMRVVLRMGVPLTQVAHSSPAGSPTALRYSAMTEWHALEENAPLPVHPSWSRYFGNEHALAMHGAEEKAASFWFGSGRLNVRREHLKRTCPEVEQDATISRPPCAYELHAGQPGRAGGLQSGLARVLPVSSRRVRRAGSDDPLAQD